jgi:hypothetical protein
MLECRAISEHSYATARILGRTDIGMNKMEEKGIKERGGGKRCKK